MAKLTAEDLLKKTLAKHKPPQAVNYLSKLYASNKDPIYLQAAASVLPEFSDDPEVFNSLLWCLQRVLFLDAKDMSGSAFDKIAYRKIGPAYLRFVDKIANQLSLPAPKPLSENIGRVLIVSTQVIDPPHSPTMVALEIASSFIRTGLAEPLILNAETLPARASSTFQPAFVGNSVGRPGRETRTHKDQQVEILNLGAGDLTLDKLQVGVDAIADFDPDIVFALGDCNLFSDLVADAYPVLCWPLTQSEPICAAHASFYRSETRPDDKLDHKKLKRAAPLRIKQDFDIDTLPPKMAEISRDQLKLPDDAYVYALVGTRIAHELSPSFQDALARILGANDKAYALIVGTNKLDLTPNLAAQLGQLRLLPFAADLRAVLATCDAFLNPPRQGGGNGAYMAVAENLPILTLDDCDVQMTIRQDAAVKTLEDLEALAIDMARNPELQADYRARSARQLESYNNGDAAIRCILRHSEATRRVFVDRTIDQRDAA